MINRQCVLEIRYLLGLFTYLICVNLHKSSIAQLLIVVMNSVGSCTLIAKFKSLYGEKYKKNGKFENGKISVSGSWSTNRQQNKKFLQFYRSS